MILQTKSKQIANQPRFDAKFVILKHGRATVPWTVEQHEGKLNYLKKCYQIEIVSLDNDASKIPTSSKSPDQPDDLQVDGQPDGSGSETLSVDVGSRTASDKTGDPGILSNGDRYEDAGADSEESKRTSRIIAALKTLDPSNDDHFTEYGKPMVAAVSEHVPDVKRNEIDAAWPEYTRDLAKTLQ